MSDQVTEVDRAGHRGRRRRRRRRRRARTVRPESRWSAEHAHHHPSPRQYVLIAVVLVVVTSVEIATSYLNTGHTNLSSSRCSSMAALKFFLVAAWYMHMKTDNAVLPPRVRHRADPRRVRVRHRHARVLEHGAEVVGLARARQRSLPGLAAAPRGLAAGRVVRGRLRAGASTRLGPRLAPAGTPVVTRFQVGSFSAGLLALWVASDWPIHDIAEQLPLLGAHGAARDLLDGRGAADADRHAHVVGALAAVTALVAAPRFATCRGSIPATIVFNVVIIVTHTPLVVNAALEHALLHFGIHALIFVSSLIVWMPVLSPLPEVPRLPPLVRMLFLFLQSVVPTVPASFLTFGATPAVLLL